MMTEIYTIDGGLLRRANIIKKLVWYSDLVDLFDHQMVRYADAQQFGIQITIWLMDRY